MKEQMKSIEETYSMMYEDVYTRAWISIVQIDKLETQVMTWDTRIRVQKDQIF